MPRRKRTGPSPSNPAEQPIDSPRAFTRDRGLELWDGAAKPLQASRNRMAEAEDITLGRIQLVPPKYLTKGNKDVARLIPKLAQRKSLVLNMTNTIAESRPTLHRQRPPKGGPTMESRAEETETAANALLLDLFPWQQSCGRAVQHAEYAVVTLLAEDMWDARPEYDDVISASEYAKLPKKEQASYRKADLDEGKSEYRRPKMVYWRDKDGRGIEDADYGRRDPKRTKKAYEDALEDHLAQHAPFAIRGYSAFDFAYEMDGAGEIVYLGIRQLMRVNDLLARGYRCKGLEFGPDGQGRAMIPTGVSAEIWGKGDRVYLYQHFTRIGGDPCVAYQVGGQDTTITSADGSEEVEAVINLREKWGFSRLPVGVYEGPHLETDDRADRPVPFMDPIGDSLIAMEGLIGSANLLAWRRGTSKIGIVPDPKVPTQAYLDSQHQLKPIDIDPDKDVVTLYGPTQAIAPLETSGDTKWVAAQLGGSIQEATPAGAVSGQGEGVDSGREAALLHTYAMSAQSMTREGLRKACEDAASFILEWACCFMRTKEIDEIPYYANVKNSIKEGSSKKDEKTVIVRLREDWIGMNYRITAKYPPTPNPVLIQQTVDLAQAGYATFDDVMEQRGKTNPLDERVQIVNDRHWMSEAGQMELQALDARQRGDIERAKQIDAALAQLAAPLAMGPDGKPSSFGPSAALDPMFQQGGMGNTTAQQQLAGTIGAGRGAAMQDFAATAGAPNGAGVMPPTNGAA